MNISNRDKMLLLILVGIIVFLFADLGVSKSYNTKTTEIESRIDSLAPTLTLLRGYNSNLAAYKAGIDKSDTSISSALSSLPTDVRSEYILMYVTQLESAVGLTADRIAVSDPALVSRFNLPRKSSDGFTLVPSAALRTEFTLSCGITYPQLKKLLAYVYSTPEMTTVKSIEVSFNSETGGLTGTVVMEKYFLGSEDYSYSKTIIPPVEKGSENLFGTFSAQPSSSSAGNTN